MQDFEVAERPSAAYAEIAAAITANRKFERNPKLIRQRIKLALPIRDMLQSLGIPAPQYHPYIQEVNRLIGEFNAANGPVEIIMVEGPSGALPQTDMKYGRPVLKGIRISNETLPPEVALRLLVRGPFGVRLKAMNKKDLEYTLRAMAEEGGAFIEPGSANAAAPRQIVFKLFEAQNTVAEHVKTLEILNELRREGYNVKVELGICFTASQKLNAEHYHDVAIEMLDNVQKVMNVDRELICGIGLKDMIGMLESEFAKEFVPVLMHVIKEHYPDIYMAFHTHQGETVDAQATAGLTYLDIVEEMPEEVSATYMVPDSLPGENHGFPNTITLLEKMGIPLPPHLVEILNKIDEKFVALKDEYAYAMPPSGNLWTREQLVYARIPGGAVPTAISFAVNPVVEELKKLEPDLDPERAKHIIANLLIHVNRKLAEDCGEAHSVTPAAHNLQLLAKDIMSGMLKNEEFRKKLIDGEADFSILPRQGTERQQAILEEVVYEIPEFYENISHPDAIAYFRGKMPFEVNPHLLTILARKSLEQNLPKILEQLITNVQKTKPGFTLSDTERRSIETKILKAPKGKKNATAVLEKYFVHENHRNPLTPGKLPRSITAKTAHSPIKALIDDVVRQHIGSRETLFDHNVASIVDTVIELVNKIPEAERRVPFKDAVLVALVHTEGITKTPKGEIVLHPSVVMAIKNPSTLYPTMWTQFHDRGERLPDGSKKTDDENGLIEGLIKEKKYTLSDLSITNPERARDLYMKYVDGGKIFRFDYITANYAPPPEPANDRGTTPREAKIA